MEQTHALGLGGYGSGRERHVGRELYSAATQGSFSRLVMFLGPVILLMGIAGRIDPRVLRALQRHLGPCPRPLYLLGPRPSGLLPMRSLR